MKNIQFLVLFLFAFLMACDESGTSVFSVEQEEFTADATGNLLVLVDKEGSVLKFEGKLILVDGECNIELYSPVIDTAFVKDTTWVLDIDQLPDSVYQIASIQNIDTTLIREVMYQKYFKAPATIGFDEEFERILGQWEFTYKIVGIGDDEPFGNFKFTLTYHN
jgi:hypothetical protein